MSVNDNGIYIPTNNWENEREKIIKEEKGKAWAGIPKVASAMIQDQDPYPSSYLSLADYQIPKTMTEVFSYCRYFYKFDSLIGGAINALARFPVTDILFDDIKNLPENWDQKEDSPILALYKEIFEDLRIEDELIRIGIDYWLYGNCIIFGEFENFSQDPSIPDMRWKRIFRLDPAKVVIDIDPLTQEKTYKWQVPAKIKKIIKDKKPKDKYDEIPDVIKQAVKENKLVVLNSDNIYHFSREGESGDGSVWGTPVVLNVMKQLAYRNILRQAQEAIAREHMVPFRIYYLEPTDRFDPQVNWGKVSRDFADQLQQAARDPNYKVVSPVPVNMLAVGGQGRALMLTAEIEQLQSEILAGMGVPREFVFGGVSYSGASISLRTLENQFITYRLLLVDFMNNFLVKRMAQVRMEWRSKEDDGFLPTIKLADLKMQDDVQQKQLAISLNATNKVSDEYLYGMLGIDSDKMKKQLQNEMVERLQMERMVNMFTNETQLMMQQQQMQLQIKMQQAMVKAGVAPDPNAPPEQKDKSSEPDDKQKKPAAEKKGEKKSNEKAAMDALEEAGYIDKEAISNVFREVKPLGIVEDVEITKLAQTLSAMDPEYKEYVLGKLSADVRFYLLDKLDKIASNPFSTSSMAANSKVLQGMSESEKIHATIHGNLGETSEELMEHNTESIMQPLPTKKPPRRDVSK